MLSTELITTLLAGVGTLLVAVIRYYHSKLTKLEETMATLISINRVESLLQDQFELTKDKIEDKYTPIRERLDRLEDKLDALLSRKE